MGEFNETVITLLQAFSSGIEVIRRLRHRRKETRVGIDESIKKEEQRLHRSLKRNRAEVRTAYSRDRQKLGDRFEKGDPKAHSSLASILLRLNSGFLSIIDRFTRGESTRGDFQALVSLSNDSKTRAINTFGQLSTRLSRSQLTLQNGEARPRHSRSGEISSYQKTGSPSSGKESRRRPGHLKSKSAPELSIAKTVLGPATPQGWVRPKNGRNASSSSTKHVDSSSRPPKVNRGFHSPEQSRAYKVEAVRPNRSKPGSLPSPPDGYATTRPAQLLITHHASFNKSHGRRHERASIVSFSSDSTKLGEIPDRHCSRPVNFAGSHDHTAFPLDSFREPEKRSSRSRFMRLFSRGD